MPTPHVLVTVLVDQISFTEFIPKVNEMVFFQGISTKNMLFLQPDCDIRLSGHVSWVGRSSIEITVWLEQELSGTWHMLTRAVFLMAAREPTGHGPAIVNTLLPVTDKEKERYEKGESRLHDVKQYYLQIDKLLGQILISH